MPASDAVTRKDDLRTGMPLWVRTPHSTVKARPRLGRDRFDVIVVSAGIRIGKPAYAWSAPMPSSSSARAWSCPARATAPT